MGVELSLFISGCYHHPGCCIPNYRIPDWHTKKYRWEQKEKYLSEHGRVIIMRECEWRRKLATLSNVDTKMGNILVEDSQESFLKAVRDEKVCGFAVCDVNTPDHLAQSMTENGFIFPPIIQRMVIDETLMSDYMKTRFIEEQRKMTTETVVQTFNCKQQLIMTPLLRKYIQLGMKVSNITLFVQFVPGKALEPFASKVYTMRCEATREGDNSKATTAKLFGNSGN